jgi:hypothetical protein
MVLQVYGVPKQLSFIASDARYQGFFAGRRVGKSYAFVKKVVKMCLRKKGFRALYLTHSNPLARELFEMMAFHPALRPLIAKIRQKEPYTITFKNGSRVEFRNWSKIDLIRGLKYHAIFIDEIQNFPERYMAIIEACTKDTRGSIIVMGQFNGFNWAFFRFYLQGQSEWLLNCEGTPIVDRDGNRRPNLTYQSWHMPSSEGLMFLGKLGRQELEETRLVTAPNVFDQEYMCLPTASLTAVYPYNELQACTGGELISQARDGMSYIQAIDVGRVVDNTVSLRPGMRNWPDSSLQSVSSGNAISASGDRLCSDSRGFQRINDYRLDRSVRSRKGQVTRFGCRHIQSSYSEPSRIHLQLHEQAASGNASWRADSHDGDSNSGSSEGAFTPARRVRVQVSRIERRRCDVFGAEGRSRRLRLSAADGVLGVA